MEDWGDPSDQEPSEGGLLASNYYVLWQKVLINSILTVMDPCQPLFYLKRQAAFQFA